MRVYCVGLNHQSSPVELRERLSKLAGGHTSVAPPYGLRGSGSSATAVLATCNRLEVYAHFDDDLKRFTCSDAYRWLTDFMARASNVSAAAFAPYLIRYGGKGALDHLCRVAAGLESAIIGEPEILGQVSRASEAIPETANTLAAVFRTAVRVGRRARRESAIGRGTASFASAIANISEDAASCQNRPFVVVAGLGTVGFGAVRVLTKRGRVDVAVLNRTASLAADVSNRYDVKGYGLDVLPDILLRADVVVLATSSDQPILGHSVVSRAMRARGRRPLVVLDVGVPRNADPSIGSIEGVRLVNVDEVGQQVDATLEGRKSAIPDVERIIGEELAAFEKWRRAKEAIPLIASLRRKAERIRSDEVRRALEAAPGLSAEARDAIEGLSTAIVQNLLREPTAVLRSSGDDSHQARLRLVTDLFDLKPDEDSGEVAA